MQSLTITITEACDDEGYFYNIYDCEADQVDDTDELDGGHCTGTLSEAIEMATDQAQAIVLATNKEE